MFEVFFFWKIVNYGFRVVRNNFINVVCVNDVISDKIVIGMKIGYGGKFGFLVGVGWWYECGEE